MQINTSLTPEQNLLAMINEANPARSFDLTQISFGLPHQTGLEPAGHNTTVTVTAIKGSGYSGSQDVNYHRIALAQALAGLSSIVQIPDSATTTKDTIDAVTAHFGLVDGEFSLNTAQSTRPTDGVTLEVLASLTPNGDSYLYTGQDISITLKWNAPSTNVT